MNSWDKFLILIVLIPIILSLIVFAITFISINKEERWSFLTGISTTGLICLFSYCIYSITISSTPTALDVYRGKTSLSITYKDTIPIDTTVVYK